LVVLRNRPLVSTPGSSLFFDTCSVWCIHFFQQSEVLRFFFQWYVFRRLGVFCLVCPQCPRSYPHNPSYPRLRLLGISPVSLNLFCFPFLLAPFPFLTWFFSVWAVEMGLYHGLLQVLPFLPPAVHTSRLGPFRCADLAPRWLVVFCESFFPPPPCFPSIFSSKKRFSLVIL